MGVEASEGREQVRVRRAALALPLILILLACPSSFLWRPFPVEADVWFVEVAQPGGCWLSPEALQAIGVDPLDASSPVLRLSRAGREVPILPLRMDEGWGVFFFAPDGSTRYTRRTAFRLELAVGERMPAGEPLEAGLPEAGAWVTTRWEEEQRYLPQADVETPWFWEPVHTPGVATHAVILEDAVPGPVTVTLHLWSHTASAANPDHLLRLRWDGRVVGEWEWDGQGMRHLSASWDEEVSEEEHTLALETPELPGVGLMTVWLDGWDVTYRRRVAADGTVWRADGSAVRVGGAGPGARLLDVSDPLAPLDLGSVPDGGMVGNAAGHRYWVGRPDEAPEPSAVRPAEAVDVEALAGATYLVLAPREFHASLQPLLEHRRGQGLEVAVVTPQAVYDTLGCGQPAPAAVQALVRSLPALRYLLVVGDGAAEPWGYDGEAGALRVVVPLTRTVVLGETPADGLLGTDGTGRPAVAVGRFPAVSIAEVETMVEKTLGWETGGELPAALLLSDDEEEFARAIEGIAALLPPGVPIERLDAGDEGGRSTALEALGRGPAWLNYVGHGSLTLVCDEGILALEDGESWREPALVVAWTCLAAHFIHPQQDSMAEAWLRVDEGGAVAFLGPVGETTTSEQAFFMPAFYRALAEGQRVGDAWLAALQSGGARDVMWGYVLLGDPALLAMGE